MKKLSLYSTINKPIVIGFIMLCFVLKNLRGQDVISKPDFSELPRSSVPEEYKWDLSAFYSDSVALNDDIAKAEVMINELTSMYWKFTKHASAMLATCEKLTELRVICDKVVDYSILNLYSDMEDQNHLNIYRKAEGMYASYVEVEAIFEEEVTKLKYQQFDAFLMEEPALRSYLHFIDDLLRRKQHILSKREREIFVLPSELQSNYADSIVSLLTVDLTKLSVCLSDGSTIVLNSNNDRQLLRLQNQWDRERVMKARYESLEKNEATLVSLLESDLKVDAFTAMALKYDNSFDAFLDEDNIDEKVFRNMFDVVHDNFKMLHRYLQLKKKVINLDTFRISDISVPVIDGQSKMYSIDEAKEVLIKSCEVMGPEYQALLDEAFSNRWIDWYGNKNKYNQPYTVANYNVHPYISICYDGSIEMLYTLTHELGHAMHEWYSCKLQHPSNWQPPLLIAEMASTMHEHLLTNYLLRSSSNGLDSLAVIENYMNNVVLELVYRKLLFGELEMAMHKNVESNIQLTATWMNENYLALNRKYYGHHENVVLVPEYVQFGWADVTKFCDDYYFLVYPVAMCCSRVMCDRIEAGGNNDTKQYIKQFLSSGGNGYPLGIIKQMGIDLTDISVYESAFGYWGKMVDQMEEIVDRMDR